MLPRDLMSPSDIFQCVHKNINELVDILFGDPNQLEQRIDQYVGLMYDTYSLLRGHDDPSLEELNLVLNRGAMITILNKEHDENNTCYLMQLQLLRMGHNSSDTNERFETFRKRFEAYAQNDPQYHAWVQGLIETDAPTSQ